ncbi:hypothetical protein [Acidithrix ferrooxidans]|uniref:DUF4145 domain-containing protein n=1 Tax=Acidithrix ferrooxidans TaxID=1280514 RepID=A0A0D8HJX1_9ACTN|nr:hypothetical protein [Acidithrix ferrooxidans]KJF18042.1 hypothetical protein AXFE_11410 [Acidithrix ferrooxidans]
MLDPKPHMQHLDILIQDFQKLFWLDENGHEQFIWEMAETLLVRLQAAIERIAPTDSPYRRNADNIDPDSYLVSRVRTLYAVALAIHEDMKTGWFESIEALAHGDTFHDFLSQSEELLNKSFTSAAAVIAGCALETHLRQLCEKESIPIVNSDGRRIKAELMRTSLYSKSIIKSYEAKQVAAWLIRNDAAHGEDSTFDRSAVSSMIVGIGAFIERYPA